MKRIEPGDRVRDRITGFTGIAMARTEWLYNCVRISVMAENVKPGTSKLEEHSNTFDEAQLLIVKRGVMARLPQPEYDDEAATGSARKAARAAGSTGGPAREGRGFYR